MKKYICIIGVLVFLSSCASTNSFDPTHPKEAKQAKAVRQGHTRGFAGSN